MRWPLLTAIVSVAVGIAAVCSLVQSGAEDVPASVADAVAQMERDWDLAASMSSVPGQAHPPASTQEVGTALDYAASSETNAQKLAVYLAGPLQSHSARFGPAVAIDARWLGKATPCPGPDYGLDARAHLLLRLAEMRRSTRFTGEVLILMRDVLRAQAHWFDQRMLAKGQEPGPAGPLPEAKALRFGHLGAAVTWSVEQFLVNMYLEDEGPLPDPAMEVVNDYWRLRKQRLLEEGTTRLGPGKDQELTIEYLLKLIDALGDQ
jgi:hypothetical protein